MVRESRQKVSVGGKRRKELDEKKEGRSLSPKSNPPPSYQPPVAAAAGFPFFSLHLTRNPILRLPSPLSSLNEEVSLFAESAKRQIRKIEEDGFRELKKRGLSSFCSTLLLTAFHKVEFGRKEKKKEVG